MSDRNDDERSSLLLATQDAETASQLTVTDALPTPLPWRSLSIVFLLTSVHPLVFELIFPFINQMIVEIGVVKDPEEVGFYSGFIESIFSCMSFLAIMPCSFASDFYGRKPVLLIGITGLAISTSLFGMSKHYWVMVVTRCLGGTLGGSWSALKIMTAEMTDKSNQGSAFSGISIAYRLGQIIGQPLGGYLAHPERRLSLFQSQFWYEFPFALPCFVAASFAMIAVILGYFLLEETLASKRVEECKTYGAIEVTTRKKSDEEYRVPVRSVLTPEFITLLLSITFMILASETLLALYPLFAFTPVQSGGLGVDEATIGTHTAIRSVANIGVMFLYGPLERRLGTLRLYQFSMFIWPCTIALLPFLNHIAKLGGGSSWFFNFTLFAIFTLWSFGCLGYTGSGIMVNDSAQSPEALATINSISQMAVVLPQAIAPAFVTSLFAYSVKSGIMNGHLVWVVLVSISSCAAAHSLTMRQSRDNWRDSYPRKVLG